MNRPVAFVVVVGIEGNTCVLAQESELDIEAIVLEEKVDVDKGGGGEAGVSGAVFDEGWKPGEVVARLKILLLGFPRWAQIKGRNGHVMKTCVEKK